MSRQAPTPIAQQEWLNDTLQKLALGSRSAAIERPISNPFQMPDLLKDWRDKQPQSGVITNPFEMPDILKDWRESATREAAAEVPTPSTEVDEVPTASAEDDEPEPFFESRDAALAHLAQVTGYDQDEILGLEQWDPQLFSYFDHWATLGPSDIPVEDWKKDLEGAQRLMESTPATGSGRKSSGDWATSKVRNNAKNIVAEDSKGAKTGLFEGGYTVHHKISRHKLRDLKTRMDDAGSAAQPLQAALGRIGTDVGAGSPLKALLNMPANLEVGPATDRRVGDPGSGFDPNLKDGAMTPRSKVLGEVDRMLSKQDLDWNELSKKLEAVHKAHVKESKGETLSAPKAEQWKKKKGGKFERS
jgi:hypothetical protein